jgi:hypothetical protein
LKLRYDKNNFALQNNWGCNTFVRYCMLPAYLEPEAVPGERNSGLYPPFWPKVGKNQRVLLEIGTCSVFVLFYRLFYILYGLFLLLSVLSSILFYITVYRKKRHLFYFSFFFHLKSVKQTGKQNEKQNRCLLFCFCKTVLQNNRILVVLDVLV